MNSEERMFHRYHIDNYWKNFQNSLDRRKTEQEYITYLEWQVSLEQTRLNRYTKELQPDLNIDHKIIVDEQTALLERIKSLYSEFRGTDQFKKIPPIYLSYGAKNNNVIALLYESLHPNCIESDFESFKAHFDNEQVLTPIKWKKQVTMFTSLFGYLEYDTSNHWEILSQHFIDSSGSPFSPHTLANVKSKLHGQKNYRGKEIITDIINKIKSINSVY